jgi:hypothetical protein
MKTRILKQMIFQIQTKFKPSSKNNDEVMHMFIVPVAYIRMPPLPPPFTVLGRQGFDVVLNMTLSRG